MMQRKDLKSIGDFHIESKPTFKHNQQVTFRIKALLNSKNFRNAAICVIVLRQQLLQLCAIELNLTNFTFLNQFAINECPTSQNFRVTQASLIFGMSIDKRKEQISFFIKAEPYVLRMSSNYIFNLSRYYFGVVLNFLEKSNFPADIEVICC
jgi:hypothetical protein